MKEEVANHVMRAAGGLGGVGSLVSLDPYVSHMIRYMIVSSGTFTCYSPVITRETSSTGRFPYVTAFYSVSIGRNCAAVTESFSVPHTFPLFRRSLLCYYIWQVSNIYGIIRRNVDDTYRFDLQITGSEGEELQI